MNTRWWTAICVTALFAITSNAALAQDRGQDSTQYRNGRVNRAQNSDNRNRHNHATFNDHDRKVACAWYNQYHDQAPVGLRYQDRLSADEESKYQNIDDVIHLEFNF